MTDEKRKPTDARSDENGNITHVKLEGNTNFTAVSKVIEMTEKGEVDLVVVNRNGEKHLRAKPDGNKANNLDEMASD